jgi:hypothetical protein
VIAPTDMFDYVGLAMVAVALVLQVVRGRIPVAA